MNTDIKITPLTLTLDNAQHGDLVVFNHAYSGERCYMLRLDDVNYRIVQRVIQRVDGDFSAIDRVGVGFDLDCVVRSVDEVGEILAIVPREQLHLTNAPSMAVAPTAAAEPPAGEREAMLAELRRVQLELGELKAAVSEAQALAEHLGSDLCDARVARMAAELIREQCEEKAKRHLRRLHDEQKTREWYQARFLKLHELRKSDAAWGWLGDGEDHLETMSDGMTVHIMAGDLKKLLREAAASAATGETP